MVRLEDIEGSHTRYEETINTVDASTFEDAKHTVIGQVFPVGNRHVTEKLGGLLMLCFIRILFLVDDKKLGIFDKRSSLHPCTRPTARTFLFANGFARGQIDIFPVSSN